MKTHMRNSAPHPISLLNPPCMYTTTTHTPHLLTQRLIDTHALLDTTPGLNYDARATRRSNEKCYKYMTFKLITCFQFRLNDI